MHSPDPDFERPAAAYLNLPQFDYSFKLGIRVAL
jgi:hypothetical protein